MKRELHYIVIMIVLAGGACTPQESEPASPPPTSAASSPALKVRASAVAGPFYPADPEELADRVQGYLDAAALKPIEADIIGLMVPHAGYEFSGPVAGYAYATIAARSYDTVILIGPSHRGQPPVGAALSGQDAWQTPLGQVPVDTELTRQLDNANDGFFVDDFAHAPEHSLEVQLPFLQTVLDEFKIVPILMADFSSPNTERVAEAIVSAVGDKNVLLVASTDMSHYPHQEAARRVDQAMLKAIAALDPQQIYSADEKLLGQDIANLHCTLCGLGPLVTVVKAARRLGAQRAEVLKYANSGDVDPATATRAVGYGAVAFVGQSVASAGGEAKPATKEEEELSRQQQQYLLTLARRTIKQYLTSHSRPEIDTSDPMMHLQRAVFVTLSKGGRLRGCIGQITARAPLAQAIQEAAISAATRDPRFAPVTVDELEEIHIEISVLSPLRQVDDPTEIQVGKHGVMVKQGQRQGVFLPQVAPEQGWDREQMLTHLCAEKAGLPPDAWERGASLYVFTAQVFSEAEE